jgi:uncharacterized protein (TIGR03067 family)
MLSPPAAIAGTLTYLAPIPSFSEKNMRCSSLLAALLLVGLPVLPLCANPEDADTPVDGIWEMTAAELAGKKLPQNGEDPIKLTVKNGTYELRAESLDRGTVTYDTAAQPKAMDIKGTEGPNKGKTFLAIYKLEGDKLTVCYDLSGNNRPTEFKTAPQTALFLAEYKRQK